MRPYLKSCQLHSRWLPVSLFAALFFSLAAFMALPAPVSADPGCAVTVTNINDSGAGSLRQAIADVCAGGTITFDATLTSSGPATITLTSGELAITKDLTISGPGANLLAVSGNNASRVFNVAAGVSATLDGLAVRNGNPGYVGGGIFNAGRLTVTNSMFSGNNTYPYSGGGIYSSGDVYSDAALTVTNSTFSGNSAFRGGGIYSIEAMLVVTNSTFSGNNATYGGALAGGPFNGVGTLEVTNSIFSGNNAPNGSNCAATLIDGGGNIDDGTSCGFSALNGSLSNTDPLLAPLGDYGGDTQTFALLPGSPAIDFGVAGSCPEEDQRGYYRWQGASCDSGAFETQGFQLVITGGTPQTTSVYSAFAQPLQVTVSSAAGDPVGPGGFITFTPPIEGPGLNVTEPFTASTDANGQVSSGVITAGAVAGSYSVTPTVRGEGFNPTVVNGVPAPAVFDLTNTRIAPDMDLSSSSNPSIYSELVVLSVNISTNVPGANTPTGVVTFTVDGNFWGAETLNAWGEAWFYDSSLSVGSHSVVAEYSGDAIFTGASDSLTQVVGKLPTTTELEINPNQAFYGDQVSFIVAVAADTPQPNALRKPSGPSGALTITDTTGVIDLSGSVVNGAATISGGLIPAGTYNVVATFMGDDNLDGSTSQPATLVVVQLPTTTTLAAAPNPSKQGESVLFTATVTEQRQGLAAEVIRPTGVVIFAAGDAEFGSAALVEGVATLSYAQLPVGNTPITARYVGDIMFTGSQSDTHQQIVLPMPLAVNDAAGAQEQPISIDVTANDQDPAGGGLTVINVGAPVYGSATVAPGSSSSVIYTPKPGYSGTDYFIYTIRDANYEVDDALVVVVNSTAAVGQGRPQVQPVSPKGESTAVFTTPAATVSVRAPAGFFTGTLETKDVLFISFTPVITPSEQTNHPPANLKFGNLEYTLEVFLNGQLLTGQSFAVPLTVTINYDPAVLGSLKPDTLGLWYWDGAAWSTDGITIINNDVVNHTIMLSMTHFSQYAFFAAAPTDLDVGEEPLGPYRIFLPAINQ